MEALKHILQHKLVAIIRGPQPADVLRIAEALYRGGVRTLEVTMNSPGALDVIRQLSKTMQDKLLLGAGTVLTPQEVEACVKAGARFIISPNVDTETIKMTRQLGAISIPGAYTATEIVLAHKTGADIVKVFPAAANPAYIKDLRGPLPHIRLMPTGGITIENIGEFKKAGAAAYGIGSALVDARQEVTEEYLYQLTVKAKQMVEAVI
ncbi:MAG: bifunctional 4-hydroxy-2-oxoglutarate aldolase/2-dehydro-3-deoxy-phosphogluconate aldolase [Flavisolibacter sp.]|nr:bifunctional 4-hydroxy-2-oxoglutarate aldolase/2-dehydro-3-deoxy-phosphogluconate aldolase [Flavisolibacter sp.]